ncbi:hypothetical protein [Pseudomonas xanthosomatis]|uniref:hypothetical protein n=1 Tax=Pseudomonas xanthosomatis TaxID=2842356 RepID=UPI003515BCA1
MNRGPEFQEFMQRYFSSFMAAYFLSTYALAATFWLVWHTYCKACTRETLFPVSLFTLVFMLVTAHAAVVRGRDWGAWLVALFCVGSIIIVLPTYSYRPHLFIYSSALLTGLSTLLVLNSRKYREMCVQLFEYRQKRKADRVAVAKRPKVIRQRR